MQTFISEKQGLGFNPIAFCARLLLLRIMEMEFKQDRAEPMGLHVLSLVHKRFRPKLYVHDATRCLFPMIAGNHSETPNIDRCLSSTRGRQACFSITSRIGSKTST